MENDARKKKLAKMLGEFDQSELAEILSSELDASTRRQIKGPVTAADPNKAKLHGKIAAQIDVDDVKNLANWTEGKDSRSCSLNGAAPGEMADGIGGKYDKMSIIFRFSSEKLRSKAVEARKTAIENTNANGE